MANRFLSNITINDQYTFPSSDGDEGQILSTTGAADGTTELQFIDQSTLNSGSAESVHISVKNTSGDQILKGTPVYVTGETGNSGKIEVAPADASDVDKMPALGLLESTLNHNGEGFCVQGGLLEGLATATIDGTLTTANDTVYVKSGGGLTMTKPTGTGLIQNIAKVARSHASNGSLVVSSILRTNDVPNLPTGRIWIGDGNTIVSDTVYVDEPNNRVGIGTDNPTALLTLESSSTSPYPGIDIKSTSTYPSGEIRFLDSSGSEVSTIESWSNPAISYLQLNHGYTTALSSTLTLDDGFLYLSTAGSERMRIKSNGDVGIGTTDPNAKLEVVGTTGVIVDSGSNSAALLTLKGDASSYGGGGQINIIGGNTDYMYYSTNIIRSGSPNINEARESYAMYGHTWTWDGNMGNTAAQPYTSYNFKSQGSSQMVIYNNNVGIGTTSPFDKLEVAAANSQLRLRDTDDNNFAQFSYSSGKLVVRNNSTTTTVNQFTLDSIGRMGIGTTSPAEKLHVNGNARATQFKLDASTAGMRQSFGTMYLESNQGARFQNTSGTLKPVTASAFNDTSDYRLKSNIVPLENAISRLKQLEVRRFNWNDRLDEPKVDGFIAHEVAPIIPEAVLGEKDAVHEDGTPNYQGIDKSKIVPLLTAALQEAISKIEQLETRIQTLENK
jgi:hypothetical protein